MGRVIMTIVVAVAVVVVVFMRSVDLRGGHSGAAVDEPRNGC